jgi:hypothetical protein
MGHMRRAAMHQSLAANPRYGSFTTEPSRTSADQCPLLRWRRSDRITNSATLRFSFVRNPYERLVSAWADKFQDRYLVAGDSFIGEYLVHRKTIDSSLPHCEHRTLTFADFVTYATATASLRVDAHWSLQDDILNMPGLALDFVGRVETFTRDIGRVLDHVRSDQRLRQAAVIPLRASPHHSWPLYYSQNLADRVYRAYESDFDRFGYPRAISFAPRNYATA